MAASTPPSDLEARVARLEAVREVEVAIQTYVRAYDGRDEERLRSVFADDAVVSFDDVGRFEGIEEILDLYRDIWARREVLNHHVTNQVVDVTGDSAVSTSYYLTRVETGGELTYSGGYWERQLERRDGAWVHTYLGIDSQYRFAADEPSFSTVTRDGDRERRPGPQDHPGHPLPLFPER